MKNIFLILLVSWSTACTHFVWCGIWLYVDEINAQMP